MPPADPCHIGLVFGGASGEHAVSIRSAATVVAAFARGDNASRYRLSCFYIDPQGRWWPPHIADQVLRAGGLGVDLEQSLDSSLPAGFRGLPSGAESVQVWFPVLHGPNGEDGTIQGLFTLMQVPFVGSGVLGSSVGMDKLAMKAAFAAAGLPQVAYAGLERSQLGDVDGPVPDAVLSDLEQRLGYPCFIKPANLGSSVGISKATNRLALEAGLRAAARLDRRLVVERGVPARELECAVLGMDHLQASVLGEICFDADWYDYDTKYSDGLSHTVIPARVPAAIADRARELALEACRAVDARGLARVDFFYAEATDELWLNEINTLPGFTSQSMYPMLWEASGLPLEALVHQLVQGAREWPQLAPTAGGMTP